MGSRRATRPRDRARNPLIVGAYWLKRTTEAFGVLTFNRLRMTLNQVRQLTDPRCCNCQVCLQTGPRHDSDGKSYWSASSRGRCLHQVCRNVQSPYSRQWRRIVNGEEHLIGKKLSDLWRPWVRCTTATLRLVCQQHPSCRITRLIVTNSQKISSCQRKNCRVDFR